jgi:hypothetical protein
MIGWMTFVVVAKGRRGEKREGTEEEKKLAMPPE